MVGEVGHFCLGSELLCPLSLLLAPQTGDVLCNIQSLMMNHCWYHTQYQVLQLPVNGPSASPHLLAARAIARPTQHVLLQPVDDPTVQQLLQLPIIVAGIVDCAQHTE
jgi:hypothetical protein